MTYKCDYLKCNNKAHWVIETSYSFVLLCPKHIEPKYLHLAAKIKSISKSSKNEV